MSVEFGQRRREVELILGRIKRLPSLPANVSRILKLLSTPNVSADEIGREIAKDQALSAEVLRLVNSGFYGVSRNITSIQQATVLLGFNVMKSLILSTSAGRLLTTAFPGLYEHSLACSKVCSLLAKSLRVGEPEEAGATGLLHDIGKMVFSEHLKDDFVRIKELVNGEEFLFKDAAEAVTGVTHIDISGYLLQKWNLPENIVAPTRAFYDIRDDDPFLEMSAILHLANIIVRAEGYGYPGDFRIPKLDHRVLSILDIGIDDLHSLMDEVIDELFELPRNGGEI